jgi:hypothetical protein
MRESYNIEDPRLASKMYKKALQKDQSFWINYLELFINKILTSRGTYSTDI